MYQYMYSTNTNYKTFMLMEVRAIYSRGSTVLSLSLIFLKKYSYFRFILSSNNVYIILHYNISQS